MALRDAGHRVDAVRTPALECDNALDIVLKLHVNEMKPAFVEATAGRPGRDLFQDRQEDARVRRDADGGLHRGRARRGTAA